jgi:hypothetical protein
MHKGNMEIKGVVIVTVPEKQRLGEPYKWYGLRV